MNILTSVQISKKFKLNPPVSKVFINQKFGNDFKQNGKWFYKEIVGGIKGHTGLDIKANIGTPCYACFDGSVTEATVDYFGGVFIRILSDEIIFPEQKIRLEALYYHLKNFEVREGQRVSSGEYIADSGNTGKYTTGAHLHFAIKVVYKDGKDYDNGYRGATDPLPLLKGFEIPRDLKFIKKQYNDGIEYLQLRDAPGGVYKVYKSHIKFLDSEKNPVTRHIPLVDDLLKYASKQKIIRSIGKKELEKII